MSSGFRLSFPNYHQKTPMTFHTKGMIFTFQVSMLERIIHDAIQLFC
jgi:hypothetical protein